MAPELMDALNTSDRPLKLLMLSHYFEEHRGGIEIVADALARALASLNFDVTWLATGPSNKVANSNRRRISLSASNGAESILKLPYPILFPSAWRVIFGEAKAADIVLVHDALYMTSVIAYIAAHVHHKPFVVVQHIGLVPYQNPFLRTLMIAANHIVAVPILRRASKVIFISQLTMSYFAKLRLREPPALIFNGVDTDVFFPFSDTTEIEETRRDLHLPGDVSIALFVGRFVEKKGLRVLEELARSRSDLFFAFAGWGALDPAKWELPNVRVYTSLSGPSLASLYRASDVLLLPSVGEGFPLVLQEALACGLPIICRSDTARADPRASPFLSGIDVDLDDPKRTASVLSEEMTRLLTHPMTPADRLKQFEFVKTNYSWAVSSSHYARLLRSLIASRRNIIR